MPNGKKRAQITRRNGNKMKMTTKWIFSARQLLPVLVMSGMMLLDGRLSFAQAAPGAAVRTVVGNDNSPVSHTALDKIVSVPGATEAGSQEPGVQQPGQSDEPQLIQQRLAVVEEEAHHDVSLPLLLLPPAHRQTRHRLHTRNRIPLASSNAVRRHL